MQSNDLRQGVVIHVKLASSGFAFRRSFDFALRAPLRSMMLSANFSQDVRVAFSYTLITYTQIITRAVTFYDISHRST